MMVLECIIIIIIIIIIIVITKLALDMTNRSRDFLNVISGFVLSRFRDWAKGRNQYFYRFFRKSVNSFVIPSFGGNLLYRVCIAALLTCVCTVNGYSVHNQVFILLYHTVLIYCITPTRAPASVAQRQA